MFILNYYIWLGQQRECQNDKGIKISRIRHYVFGLHIVSDNEMVSWNLRFEPYNTYQNMRKIAQQAWFITTKAAKQCYCMTIEMKCSNDRWRLYNVLMYLQILALNNSSEKCLQTSVRSYVPLALLSCIFRAYNAEKEFLACIAWIK